MEQQNISLNPSESQYNSEIILQSENIFIKRPILVSRLDMVVLLNLPNGGIVREWYESASPVLSLVALPNQAFIVGRQDGTCTVLSLHDASNRLRVQLTGSDCDGIRDLSFNGKWVFAGCRDATVRKYDFNQINVHFK